MFQIFYLLQNMGPQDDGPLSSKYHFPTLSVIIDILIDAPRFATPDENSEI